MASIDKEIKTNFKNDKHRFVTNLMFTSTYIKNMMSKTLKPFDLSSEQFNILRILRGAGDWTAMNVVKDRMVEKSPNATRLADKLINKELIERERCDSDRRVVFVKISTKGLELLTEIDQLSNEEFESFLDGITNKEAIAFSAILDKMRD